MAIVLNITSDEGMRLYHESSDVTIIFEFSDSKSRAGFWIRVEVIYLYFPVPVVGFLVLERLASGFQSPGFRIPNTIIYWIPEFIRA